MARRARKSYRRSGRTGYGRGAYRARSSGTRSRSSRRARVGSRAQTVRIVIQQPNPQTQFGTGPDLGLMAAPPPRRAPLG